MNVHKPLVWRSFAIAFTVLVCLLTTMPTFAQTNFPTTGVILRDANLRAGAGTTFAIAGTGRSGQQVTIVEANHDTTWYHLGTGEWIAAFLVELKAANTDPTPASASANVLIQDIFYDGNVPNVESDEYAVIANTGTQAINLQGWQLSAGTLDQVFTFPNLDLQPGQTCRVYTNESHPDSCGLSFGSGSAFWNNKGDCGYLYEPSGKHVSTFCYGDITGGEVYTSGAVAATDSTANRVANLRGGPGTNFPVVGSVQNGQTLTIVSKNTAGDWYQLGNGQWIAAFLVNNAPGELLTTDAAPPTEAPAQVEAPTPVPQPAAPPTATPNPLAGQRSGAICRDGTSSGATGRGACSHHGGVDHWLYY